MPSPFPGMDPYLERPALWPMVHGLMITELCYEINARLPRRYLAKIDPNVYAVEGDRPGRTRGGQPDVEVLAVTGASAASAVAVTAPVQVVEPAGRVERWRSISVRDADDDRLVTALELLSPINKRRGSAYRAKRRRYARQQVNLVEIDLLRAGRRMPFRPRPAGMHYCVLVRQPTSHPRAGLWPFTVRDPLPTVLVPLSGAAPAVPLPLRPALDALFDRSRLGEYIYDHPPVPPPAEPDATWAAALAAAYLAEGR